MRRLLRILSLKRGHDSQGEAVLVNKVLAPYNPEPLYDPFGEVLAYVVRVGESRTLFSCHIDTVHNKSDSQVNLVVYDQNLLICYKEDNTPLGADDGAGVWLLLEMIDAAVPGTYVFHRGEERGGFGSRGIAEHHYEFLTRFDRAVAFDRRGTGSVITHQLGLRCCSDDFAVELSARLNDYGLAFSPDDTGIYTDTAEYMYVIPECTNISVGYDNEHTRLETLDVAFLMSLRDACIRMDWESLPTNRSLMEVYYDEITADDMSYFELDDLMIGKE